MAHFFRNSYLEINVDHYCLYCLCFGPLDQFYLQVYRKYLYQPIRVCHHPLVVHLIKIFGWRIVVSIVAGINVIIAIPRILVPDSPIYTYNKGHDLQALAILKRISKVNGKILPPIKIVEDEQVAIATQERNEQSLVKSLFNPLMRLTTILLWIIWFCFNFGFTSFMLFLPKLLQSKGLKNTGDIYTDSLISSTAGFPGPILGAFLVETVVGRKGTMILSTILMTIFLIGFQFAKTQLQLIVITFFTNFFAQIVWSALYTYTPEVYPTNIRTTGNGIAMAWNNIAGIAAPFIGGILLSNSAALSLTISYTTVGVAAICMILLPIETRRKGLE